MSPNPTYRSCVNCGKDFATTNPEWGLCSESCLDELIKEESDYIENGLLRHRMEMHNQRSRKSEEDR